MNETIKINAEIDLEAIKETIEKSGSLDDNEAIFGALSQVETVKSQLKEILDQVASIEAEVKSTIKSKAVALYGAQWVAIKGEGYKITRSKSGAVYTITGKPNKKFLKVVESVDSKAVDAFVTANSKLPAGIEPNPSRGDVIKITVAKAE
jgi:hypothetical protein